MPVARSRQHVGVHVPNNRFSSIIPEEELDINNNERSPYMDDRQKMSAIGFPDEYAQVKESPFWNNENAYDFQHALTNNSPFNGQALRGEPLCSDDFRM